VFYHITFEGGILRRDAPFTSETAAFGGVNYQMKFSYDNTKLVWIREATLCGGVCREVWISDRDMSNPVQITSDGFTDDRPALSPDNQRVVFSSRRDGGEGGDLDLFYMKADGTGITQLTATTDDDWAPVYSRDGTKILFYSTRSGDRALWIMNADGSSPRMLPGTEGLGWEGRWSPDDKWIAFNGIADVVNTRDWAVWIMPSDGSAEPVRLTPEGEVEQIFGWIPG
jgi:TolB protein